MGFYLDSTWNLSKNACWMLVLQSRRPPLYSLSALDYLQSFLTLSKHYIIIRTLIQSQTYHLRPRRIFLFTPSSSVRSFTSPTHHLKPQLLIRNAPLQYRRPDPRPRSRILRLHLRPTRPHPRPQMPQPHRSSQQRKSHRPPLRSQGSHCVSTKTGQRATQASLTGPLPTMASRSNFHHGRKVARGHRRIQRGETRGACSGGITCSKNNICTYQDAVVRAIFVYF